jgi:hypothetical protein
MQPEISLVFKTGLILNQIDPVHIVTLFLNINFNIIFSSTPTSSEKFFLQAFEVNFVSIPRSATRTACNLILLDMILF